MNKSVFQQKGSFLSKFILRSPEDKLGSVLVQTKTSHDPIFVFDNEIFMGLVSPYRALYFNRYPYETKISHCLIKPPHITSLTSYYDIAQHMLALKIYSLPMFNENGQIEKIINIDTILTYICSQPALLQNVCSFISPSSPVTAPIHSTVKDIYGLMREKGIGRVILVNDENKIGGIIARRDLQDAFTAKTVRQRYVTREKIPIRSGFDEEEITRHESPALEFATTPVLTAPDTMPIEKIIQRMIQSKYQSIVIVKNGGIPSGFISRHDILKAFTLLKPKKEVQITWTKHLNGLREYRLMAVYDRVFRFMNKFNKQFPIHRATVHIDQTKNAAGYPKRLFTITIHIHLKSGPLILTKTQKWGLVLCLREAFKKIENEVDMSDRQKHDIKKLKHF